MDWKYAHFSQTRVFKADRDAVKEAFNRVAKDWLGDWRISETSEGFEASGYSGLHLAIAKFHFEPVQDGTKASVEIRAQRASSRGFMLWDIGGFYDGQIRKWLEALAWWVDHPNFQDLQATGQAGPGGPLGPPRPTSSKLLGGLFGCLIVFVVFGVACMFIMYTVFAAIGVVTGTLNLPGSHGDLIVHKPWGRIVSAAILLGIAWIVSAIWRVGRRKRS